MNYKVYLFVVITVPVLLGMSINNVSILRIGAIIGIHWGITKLAKVLEIRLYR